jgi:hypothetical protein
MIPKKKLNKAFELMRRAGLIADQNFACCTSCATAALEDEVDSVVLADIPCVGFAYYHGQDEDARKEGLDFYIGYGAPADQDTGEVPPGEPVAKIICDCLTNAGVPHFWTGSARDKVRVRLEDLDAPLDPREERALAEFERLDSEKTDRAM